GIRTARRENGGPFAFVWPSRSPSLRQLLSAPKIQQTCCLPGRCSMRRRRVSAFAILLLSSYLALTSAGEDRRESRTAEDLRPKSVILSAKQIPLSKALKEL